MPSILEVQSPTALKTSKLIKVGFKYVVAFNGTLLLRKHE